MRQASTMISRQRSSPPPTKQVLLSVEHGHAALRSPGQVNLIGADAENLMPISPVGRFQHPLRHLRFAADTEDAPLSR
jgi:hypothetical protein